MKLSMVVQAGGESRRMGRNKALVPFFGRPLIQAVLERLRDLGDETIVTTNESAALSFLGLPCHPDVVPNRGALGGLHTALASAAHPLVAVVACDMPFASAELLRLCLELAWDYDLVIPRSRSGLEPLHALYRRDTCLPAVERALKEGLWRVDAWFPWVRLRVLEAEDYGHLDPDGRIFFNVNTQEDLLQAEALAQPHARVAAEGTGNRNRCLNI